MKAVYLKEIRSFLSSLIGYVTLTVFLVAMGLFLWIFPKLNVFDNGYANLDALFYIAPQVFIFLISAITMRSFSEEKRTGTIELLLTKPLTDLQIILGKYFAALTLVVIALLPTVLYIYTIYILGSPAGNFDAGAMAGSYIGLLLLAAVFCAIGIFASLLSDNQIVAFILAMFLNFFFYSAFGMLADFNLLGSADSLFQWLSMDTHYSALGRGVIDSRDVVYFFSLSFGFLWAGKMVFAGRNWS